MLSIYCGESYPAEHPQIKFNSKVNLDCVDDSGNVNFASLPISWSSSESMETVLISLFSQMKSSNNKSSAQPADGEMY